MCKFRKSYFAYDTSTHWPLPCLPAQSFQPHCSLLVHSGVCNILLYRGCCSGGFNEPVINRSQALNYTAAQFKVLVFISSNYVAEGMNETVSIDYSITKYWVSELNIWTTFITCVSTNKPEAQFLTHPMLPHRVKPEAVIYFSDNQVILVDYRDEWGT